MSICSHYYLISEYGRSATAVSVVSCNHSDPGPAEMLDKLYKGTHLEMKEMKVLS